MLDNIHSGPHGGGLVAKVCPTLVTPWTIACRAPLSMEFSRQEYWSGLPFPSPGYFSDPGIEPGSPALQAVSLPIEPRGKPSGPHITHLFFVFLPTLYCTGCAHVCV